MIFRHLLLPFVLIAAPAPLAEPLHAQEPDPAAIEVAATPSSPTAADTEDTSIKRYMPLIGIGSVPVILIIIFGFIHRMDANRHATIRKYLELGKDVPPQLLSDSGDPGTWNKDGKRRRPLTPFHGNPGAPFGSGSVAARHCRG